MNVELFNKILDARIDRLRALFERKRAEYASDVDVLINFRRGAELMRCTPERVLGGYVCKHILSVYDIIDKIERGGRVEEDVIDEKVGDVIVYMVLLEGLYVDRQTQTTVERKSEFTSAEVTDALQKCLAYFMGENGDIELPREAIQRVMGVIP